MRVQGRRNGHQDGAGDGNDRTTWSNERASAPHTAKTLKAASPPGRCGFPGGRRKRSEKQRLGKRSGSGTLLDLRAVSEEDRLRRLELVAVSAMTEITGFPLSCVGKTKAPDGRGNHSENLPGRPPTTRLKGSNAQPLKWEESYDQTQRLGLAFSR